MLGYLAFYSRPRPANAAPARRLLGLLPHEIAALSRRGAGRNA